MTTSKDIGNRGEEIASIYLKQQGYTIIDRNWLTRWCEIDIIALKDNTAFLVEVKYRSNTAHGTGFDYITPKKIRQMQFAAELWATRQKNDIDIVLAAMSVDGNTESVEFIEIV
ncbi:YraN family protein [bacterium]|nr:YraN family protein [bacterium]NBX98439.1 YraN family protein [bacterium]NDC94119.1 YraN family protein [bacterium]NDD83340.1 YraN family protein [bacterium]NDG28918.1 YraN family protein [bacterium]